MNSGAHCELDRRSPAHPNGDKTFIIRGEPEQIEAAKRIISDKVQLPINFVAAGGNVSNALPTVSFYFIFQTKNYVYSSFLNLFYFFHIYF